MPEVASCQAERAGPQAHPQEEVTVWPPPVADGKRPGFTRLDPKNWIIYLICLSISAAVAASGVFGARAMKRSRYFLAWAVSPSFT